MLRSWKQQRVCRAARLSGAGRASPAMLAAIVANSDDAIIAVALDGVITSWNHAAELLFGFSASELVGQNILRLLPPDRRDDELFILGRIRDGLKVDRYEAQRLTKTGELIDVEISVSPIRDSAGRIIGASKFVRDIAALKHKEAALKESEWRFRQLADVLPQIVWEADSAGHLEYVNRRWYDVTGLPSEAELGRAKNEWNLVVHPEDADKTHRRWDEAVKSGKPFWNEIRLRNVLTNQYRWHLVRGLPVTDDQGRVLRWFGTSTDIDDMRRAEEQAKEQQAELAHLERVRTMGQMAAGLAHELNQPLGAIMNYSIVLKGMLDKIPDKPANAVQILDEVVSEVARAGEIIRRLRSFVKKQSPMTTRCDLNELLIDTLGLLSFDLRQASIVPTVTLTEELPEVAVDGVQIQQVVVNLVRNAIDAMDEIAVVDRKLTIATTIDDGVRLTITDSGCGIPPENLNRIFDSFFTTKSHGLGMGLALCRTIVEEHHGSLTARSEPGGGSTFSLRLPLLRPSKSSAGRAAGERAASPNTTLAGKDL
ncbi:MAG: PAS domain S-box protein [Tepidisphaeraceae bacterium]